MSTLEERVALVEGSVKDQAVQLADVRADIRALRDELGRRFEAVDQRFANVDRQLSDMRADMGRQFMWVVGLQMASVLAIIGALLNLR